MSVESIWSGVKGFWSRHSDKVLTGIGVASIFTTGIEAACATPGFVDEWDEEEPEGFWEKAKIVAKHYWVPITNAVLGGTAMICATKINHTERAALAGALTMAQVNLRDYEHQIVEEFGEAAHQKLTEKRVQKKLEENPPEKSTVIVTDGDSTVLFYDEFSGRYFRSTMYKVQAAINYVNNQIVSNVSSCVELNEFYDQLGLPELHPLGEDMYFTVDNLLDVTFSGSLNADRDTPCIAMSYMPELLCRSHHR